MLEASPVGEQDGADGDGPDGDQRTHGCARPGVGVPDAPGGGFGDQLFGGGSLGWDVDFAGASASDGLVGRGEVAPNGSAGLERMHERIGGVEGLHGGGPWGRRQEPRDDLVRERLRR